MSLPKMKFTAVGDMLIQRVISTEYDGFSDVRDYIKKGDARFFNFESIIYKEGIWGSYFNGGSYHNSDKRTLDIAKEYGFNMMSFANNHTLDWSYGGLISTLEALKDTGATYLFVLMGLKTGLRRGELLGLMWDAIDLDKGEIKVFRNLVIVNGHTQLEDTTKTKAGVRTVPVPDSLLELLKAEKAKTTSFFVFHKRDGSMMSQTAYKNLWHKVQIRHKNISFTPKKNNHLEVKRIIDFDVTPHILRHTYITRLFEAGLDIKEVQYLAGHADVTVTMKIYTHYSESRKPDTFAKVRAALG